MPIVGTLDITPRLGGAPVMPALETEPLSLPGAELFQLIYEIDATGLERLVPRAVSPTTPPILNLQVLRCAETEIGPVTMAQARIGCRAGMFPRNLLLMAVVEQPAAAAELATRWGYRCLPGEVKLRAFYDRVDVVVTQDGETILDSSLVDPVPLSPNDLWYSGNLNLAETPRGPRLVHVEPAITVTQADRGLAHIGYFDAAAWGDANVRPVFPVSASFVRADIVLPRPVALTVPDVVGPEGMERLD